MGYAYLFCWANGDNHFRIYMVYISGVSGVSAKGAFVWDILEWECIPEYIPAILLLGAE